MKCIISPSGKRSATNVSLCNTLYGTFPMFRDLVKAMGGELKITARFPDGTVEINQFEAVKKAAAGS